MEKIWLETINKKNPKIKNELSQINEQFDLVGLENLICKEKEKHYDSKPNLATRQCSMITIEKISELLLN